MFSIKGKEILITGGTGTLGRGLLKEIEKNYSPKGIRIFSRDEYKQWQMKQEFKEAKNKIAYLIGDIRDLKRLELAMEGVDIVIHAAAMKHITTCEEDPPEAIATNITGTKNVIFACLEKKIQKAFFISSDKSVYPINLYGMTKAIGERMFIQANQYSAWRTPSFSCFRYGNVLNSRGSIVELFKKQKEKKEITITRKDMTRYWITIEEVATFILNNIQSSSNGEIIIPKMPSMNIMDIANAIVPDAKIKEIGIRAGEKIHECLISKEENSNLIVKEDKWVIDPLLPTNKKAQNYSDFVDYTSQNNFWKMTKQELLTKIGED